MQKVLIIGAGTGGSIILDLVRNLSSMEVVAIVDTNDTAPGIQKAKEYGIPSGSDWTKHCDDSVDIIIDVTGNESVFMSVVEEKPKTTVLIPGSVASIIVQLLEENHSYTKRIHDEMFKQRMIFDSIDEGMVGINEALEIDFFNRRAEAMTGISATHAIGKKVHDVIPNSKLDRVLQSGKTEINQGHALGNGLEIVTSRFPLQDEHQNIVGAFAVFKDMTEVIHLANEITDLEKVQKMLEAIIYSSDDAISVVDEHGYGILVNPAYTRLTGLTEEEVIGKPATVDIIEGESIHMKVLETKKPVRGVNMRIGENDHEVIVNVAPIVVDDEVKGSVGIIHDITEMRGLMTELDQARAIIRELESTGTFDEIKGHSPLIKLAIEQAKLAAQNDFPVLLRGEVGSGKELFAHAIHSEGNRKFNKYIRVNCAAIEPEILQKKLFGEYQDGIETKVGLLKEVHQGTLFLDEIAELSIANQEKLLHFLKTNEFCPLNSTDVYTSSIHVITASSRNLEKLIHEGFFMEELYYFLNRMAIHIPSLRDRKEDISTIVDHLIDHLNRQLGTNIESISREAEDLLQNYDWPGNIREVENVLNRAMIFMSEGGSELRLADIESSLHSTSKNEKEIQLPAKSTLASIMDDYERSILEKALLENKGNKSETATRLGISLRSLYYKLDKYRLD